MVNNEEGYFAIPYEVWSYSDTEDADEEGSEEPEDSYDTGVLLFKAGNNIGSVDRHSLDGSSICRSVYIGDWVYALDADGNVNSFKPSF